MKTASPKMSSLLLRIPSDLRRRLRGKIKKGNLSKYIISAIEEKIQLEGRRKWVDQFMKSDRIFRFELPQRDWPTDRFYTPKKK